MSSGFGGGEMIRRAVKQQQGYDPEEERLRAERELRAARERLMRRVTMRDPTLTPQERIASAENIAGMRRTVEGYGDRTPAGTGLAQDDMRRRAMDRAMEREFAVASQRSAINEAGRDPLARVDVESMANLRRAEAAKRGAEATDIPEARADTRSRIGLEGRELDLGSERMRLENELAKEEQRVRGGLAGAQAELVRAQAGQVGRTPPETSRDVLENELTRLRIEEARTGMERDRRIGGLQDRAAVRTAVRQQYGIDAGYADRVKEILDQFRERMSDLRPGEFVGGAFGGAENLKTASDKLVNEISVLETAMNEDPIMAADLAPVARAILADFPTAGEDGYSVSDTARRNVFDYGYSGRAMTAAFPPNVRNRRDVANNLNRARAILQRIAGAQGATGTR